MTNLGFNVNKKKKKINTILNSPKLREKIKKQKQKKKKKKVVMLVHPKIQGLGIKIKVVMPRETPFV